MLHKIIQLANVIRYNLFLRDSDIEQNQILVTKNAR